MLVDYIFIYHLDAELLKLYINPSHYNLKDVSDTFSLVLRIAFLLCKKSLLIPASNFFESDMAFNNISFFSPLLKYDTIHFLSNSGSLELLLKKKKIEHEGNTTSTNFHYDDYYENKNGLYLPGTIHQRTRSASNEIKKSWLHSIGDPIIWDPYFISIDHALPRLKFEKKLAKIPERLENRAYISDYVVPLLEVDSSIYEVTNRFVNVFITREYIKNFLLEYQTATALCDIPYINSNEILPTIPGRDYISYSKYAVLLQRQQYRNCSALDYILNCTAMDLLEFKNSIQWYNILFAQEKVDRTTYIFGGITMENLPEIKIGVVTALPEEFAAFKALLNNAEEHKGLTNVSNDLRCIIGTIKGSNSKDHNVGLFLLPEYGNNMASIYATKIKTAFPLLENLIMCGIAGGIPEKEHLGDVVVSTDGVFQYDYGKNEAEKFSIKDNGTPCSLFLKEAVGYFRAAEYENGSAWKNHINTIGSKLDESFMHPPKSESYYVYDIESNNYQNKSRRCSKSPCVYYGRISSGNCVQKDPRKRDMLYLNHNVLAIEMEAAGIKDSARATNIGYLVVRGISDFCDLSKNDNCHNYASAVAASYTVGLLESIPA